MHWIKKQSYTLWVIVFLLCIAFFFQFKNLNKLPFGIHTWAQSDHLALSYGFYDNGLDFFHPQTYVLNKQFPDNFKTPYPTGITSADFPIHAYIPAVAMKIYGAKTPFIYRLYLVLYSLVGFLFLFKLVHNNTQNLPKSILVLMFALCSPVLLYYQSRFLPSIPSLANVFIGLYFYLEYLKENKSKPLILGLFFFTLAALGRTTFVIPLLAIIGNEGVRMLRKNTAIKWKVIFASACSILFVLSYWLYNGYLRKVHGSIFLGELIPARSMEDVHAIFDSIVNYWGWHYFSKYQVFVFVFILFLSLWYSIKKRIPKNEVLSIKYLLFFWFLGELLFFIAMMRQFTFHDYYFLDTFYVWLVFTFFLLVRRCNFNTGFLVFLIVGCFYFFIKDAKTMVNYWDNTSSNDLANKTRNNFENVKDLLAKNKVKSDSKIIVYNAFAPNLPFLQMDRKGYALLNGNEEIIRLSMDWKYEYAIVQKAFFEEEIYRNYPGFINEMRILDDNNKLLLLKHEKHTLPYTLEDFIGFKKNNEIYSNALVKRENEWEGIKKQDGDYAYLVDSSQEFGPTLKTFALKESFGKERAIRIRVNLRNKEQWKACDLVLSLSNEKETFLYQSFSLKDRKEKEIQLDKTLYSPVIHSKDVKLSLYLWNIGKNKIDIKDFEINIY